MRYFRKVFIFLVIISIIYTAFVIPWAVGFGYEDDVLKLNSITDIIFLVYSILRIAFILYRASKKLDDELKKEDDFWDFSEESGEELRKVNELLHAETKESSDAVGGIISRHESLLSEGSLENSNDTIWISCIASSNRVVMKFILYLIFPNGLFCDVLCNVPFDEYFGDKLLSYSHLIHMAIYYKLLLRLPKLARLIRWKSVMKYVIKDNSEKPTWAGVFSVFCAFLLVVHWFVCLWNLNTVIPFTCEPSEMEGGSTYWATVQFVPKKEFWDGSVDASVTNPDSPNYVKRWTRYITIFYFVAWNFMSLGFGDMHGQNNSERLIQIAMMIIGSLYLSYFLSVASNYITSIHEERTRHEEEISIFSLWLEQNNVSSHITSVALDEIFHIYENTPTNVDDSIKGLPPSFAAIVVSNTHSAFFSDNSALKSVSKELRFRLSPYLYSVQFQPGDIISEILMPVHDVIFILGGFLEAVCDIYPHSVYEDLHEYDVDLSQNTRTVGYYTAGSIPSISAIMNKTYEDCTIRALTPCVACMISLDKFNSIFQTELFESDETYFLLLAEKQSQARSRIMSTSGNGMNNDANRSESSTLHDDVEATVQSTISYLNDEEKLNKDIPFPKFPPTHKAWSNVIRTKRYYLYAASDISSTGLWWPSSRAYIANYFGINYIWLVGKANSHKLKLIVDEETYESLLYRGVLPPKSPYKILWDLFVGVVIIYACIMTPLELGYDVFHGQYDIHHHVITAIFLLDILVSLRSTKSYPSAIPTNTVPWKLARRYLRGSFIFDFIASMPWDSIFAELLNGDAQDLMITRIIRLFRLVRLLKVFQLQIIIDNLYFLKAFLVKFRTLFTLVFMATQLAYLCHLFGCLFAYSISLSNDDRDWWRTYILTASIPPSDAPVIILDPYRSDDGSLRRKYLAGFYWATSALSTTGIGDIAPASNLERIFTTFTIIIGVYLFNLFAGRINTLITTKSYNGYVKEKLTQWHSFAKRNKISKSMRKKVALFHKRRLTDDSIHDTTSLLNALPYYIRRKTLLASEKFVASTLPKILMKKYISEKFLIPIIKIRNDHLHVPAEFANAVLLCLRERWLLPLEDCQGNLGMGKVFYIVFGHIHVSICTDPLDMAYSLNRMASVKHKIHQSTKRRITAQSELFNGDTFFPDEAYIYSNKDALETKEDNTDHHSVKTMLSKSHSSVFYNVIAFSRKQTKILILDDDLYDMLLTKYETILMKCYRNSNDILL